MNEINKTLLEFLEILDADGKPLLYEGELK